MTIATSMVVFLYTNQAINYVTLSNSNDMYGSYQWTTCQGESLVGGFNLFGQGTRIEHTFTMPVHKKIKISFKLFYVDSWDKDQGDYLHLQVDGATVKSMTKDGPQDGSQICGSGQWNDEIGDVSWEGSHTASTLKITFYDTFYEAKDNESWGFNGFQIQYDDPCIYLYSECNYTGTKYAYCDYDYTESQVDFPAQIKSFKIPTGKKLSLQDNNFQTGTLVTYTSNQSCVSGYSFPRQLFVP